MEEKITFLLIERQPQQKIQWKNTSILFKSKMTSNYLKMDPDLNFFKLEDDLKYFYKLKTTSKCSQMEDDLNILFN